MIDSNNKQFKFIANQNTFKNMPYGTYGNVVDNGCGFIACYNALKYFGYDINYIDVYKYFNRDIRLNFFGKWGTNPFSVKKYLKRILGNKVKLSIGKIPNKKYDAYIIVNIYKLQNRNGISAHYVFGYFDKNKFKTYNLTKSYDDINHYLNKNTTTGKLFIVYGINRKKDYQI